MEKAHLKIHGIVQGVFFRANTQEMASKLGIQGFVKNTPDGCVEILAVGDKDALEKLISWCHKGPPGAKIDKVDVSWGTCEASFSGFRITY